MTEIFIEPELENLEVAENAAEWFEICTSLGLKEQIRHADRSEEKKAPPYMFIDPKTDKIIVTLCPRVVNYMKYSASTIPLDILQEIAKAEKNGWYKEIHIAYDDKSPDPFVIGITHSQHSWNASKHLIGRWGSELLPFEQLEQKAISRLMDVAIIQLSEMKHKIDMALSNPTIFIKHVLAGKDIPSLKFHIGSISSGGGDLPF